MRSEPSLDLPFSPGLIVKENGEQTRRAAEGGVNSPPGQGKFPSAPDSVLLGLGRLKDPTSAFRASRSRMLPQFSRKGN